MKPSVLREHGRYTASLLIHPEELSRAWIDRAADNGIPTLALHPVGGGNADASMAGLLSMTDEAPFLALLDHAAARGLTMEYEMHAMRYFLPASLFDAHPDWFRENEAGERVSDWNCCASNGEGLAFIARRAAEAAKRLSRPLCERGMYSHRWFFWMDDVRGGFCHCEKCRRLSPSDQQLLVMNRILAELKRDDPHAKLAYLAYCECTRPPEQVRPDAGIFLEFAPFDRDFHIPLASDASEKNRLSRQFLPALLAWFGRGDAKVLDYWLDNSLYSGWKKPPARFTEDRAVAEADFAYYRSLGFTDISTFACYLSADYEALYGEADISAVCAQMRALQSVSDPAVSD